ncbi:hypothetical protein HRM2_41240 [Desulforapulum autotrophicum HRM2]|uniref:Uncharacterized protein n=1 Tax=Desulforapulum autotrophicum (strain ATCC 43914 / DSM 3382 / VKM B-1955 / HRM2) TaxID=177437 RepID=C0QCU9_DESAH|nr:hypothetical protein [Desulforapulum autotrophicum]ACN17181.1 hypothetical protein HRM2_41240 [Desulforapulum autotrophicum HRM2]
MTVAFKHIAWNGISLDLPMDWQVATLGVDHLFLEDNNGPALEITWAGKFQPGRLEVLMARFVLRAQQRFSMAVVPLTLPLDRVTLGAEMDLAWFSWAAHPSRGKGVLMGCSQCRRLFILRFFTGVENLSDSLVEKVVFSFKENCGKGPGHWKLFGLELTTPDGFKLSNYSFRPGSFMMDFKARFQSLTAYSWGPAAFLLLTDNLEAFARKRVDLPDIAPREERCDHDPFLAWDWEGVAWPLVFLRQRQAFRVHHNRRNNRIIGLRSRSRGRYGAVPWNLERLMKGCLD